MAYQAERARVLPRRTGSGCCARSTAAARSASSTFAGLYRATLERIEARGFDVFDGPPQLSALTKLRIVGEGLRR